MIPKETKEHYYYCIYHEHKWQIVKAHNQKEMKKAGYNIKLITAKYRHYASASAHIRQIYHPGRIYYVSLTGVDYID